MTGSWCNLTKEGGSPPRGSTCRFSAPGSVAKQMAERKRTFWDSLDKTCHSMANVFSNPIKMTTILFRFRWEAKMLPSPIINRLPEMKIK